MDNFKIKTGKKAKATRFANVTVAGLAPPLGPNVKSNFNTGEGNQEGAFGHADYCNFVSFYF